jgi:hypothetical protein
VSAMPTDDAARKKSWERFFDRWRESHPGLVPGNTARDAHSWGYDAGYAQAMKDLRVVPPETSARLEERGP